MSNRINVRIDFNVSRAVTAMAELADTLAALSKACDLPAWALLPPTRSIIASQRRRRA